MLCCRSSKIDFARLSMYSFKIYSSVNPFIDLKVFYDGQVMSSQCNMILFKERKTKMSNLTTSHLLILNLNARNKAYV